MELFSEKDVVRICAPMVRYSKLPFRMLVRKYGCDLVHTPMIVSDSFVKSAKARDVEFTTCKGDRPLVVQFAANNAKDFADAAELVAPYADAVDLNCGCPQSWAMAEGYGAHLIGRPELVVDMVRQAKARSGLPVSIKIRVHSDLSKTVELARRAEHAGVSWITVHGRTPSQRAEPVNLEAIKLAKQSVGVPVVANGDIRSESDVIRVQQATGVNGVMAARGILENPAMYAGYDHTPLQCVQDWVDISLGTGVTFTQFHHHLMHMLERVTPRTEKSSFNSLTSTPAVLDYLSRYGIG